MLSLGMITIVVDDYDVAKNYYLNKLGFKLIEDSQIDSEKRWVVVSPGEFGANILLAKAGTRRQQNAIGKSAGGRVGFFLFTNNFEKTYKTFKQNRVKFLEDPREESYGRVVVFCDKYGNKWDLIEAQKRKPARALGKGKK